jgi:Sec-independent protein translocase protein TatA
MLGMTRGEIALVAFIFALVFVATRLPRVVAALDGRRAKERP